MRGGIILVSLIGLALLGSCASGPKPPASNVDHAQEIREWVDQFARTCLDRNLTTRPNPQVGTYLPRKMRFNYEGLLAAGGGSGVPHSCAFWRSTGGVNFMGGSPHMNSDDSTNWNTGFFIYQHHQVLVNAVKEVFGVVYHEAQRSISSCGDGTHHSMLLRDGKTVLYLDFMYWSSRGTYCRDKNRYQAVMLRVAQPCSRYGQMSSICGPRRDTPEHLKHLGGSSGMQGGYVVNARWTNDDDITEDVVVHAIDVLNLDRLDPDQQIEAARRWDEEVDQLAYFANVARLSDWIANQKIGIREANQHWEGLISDQYAQQRERSDNFANMFAETMGQALSNLQQSSNEVHQRQAEVAQATQQTLQQHQQIQTIKALEEQRFFDSRQLPAANPMTRPISSDESADALPPNVLASREARCKARAGHQWEVGTGQCIAPQAVASRPATPATASSAAPAASVTPNQCWFVAEPPHESCVDTQLEWSNGELLLRNRNVCSRRIYVRACAQRSGQQDFCAVSGILPGGQWSHRVYANWQPTGAYNVNWVGSDRGVEDWTCAGEAGWNR